MNLTLASIITLFREEEEVGDTEQAGQAGEGMGEASEVTKEAEREPWFEEVGRHGDLVLVVAGMPQLVIPLEGSQWAICLGQSPSLNYNHRSASKIRLSRLQIASM